MFELILLFVLVVIVINLVSRRLVFYGIYLYLSYFCLKELLFVKNFIDIVFFCKICNILILIFDINIDLIL